MKSTVLACAFVLLTSQAFAADEIEIPRMATLPFVITTAGEVTKAQIKIWGLESDSSGFLDEQNNRIASKLLGQACALNFPSARNSLTGQIEPTQDGATLECSSVDGRAWSAGIKGVLINTVGLAGISGTEEGATGYFLIQASLSVPTIAPRARASSVASMQVMASF